MELMFLQESNELDLSSIFTEEELENFKGMTADELLLEAVEEYNETFMECVKGEVELAFQESKGILNEEGVISSIISFAIKAVGAVIKFIGKCIMFVVNFILKGIKAILVKLSSLLLEETDILNEADGDFKHNIEEGKQIPDDVITEIINFISKTVKDPEFSKFMSTFDNSELKELVKKDLEKDVKKYGNNEKEHAKIKSFIGSAKEIQKGFELIEKKVENGFISAGQVKKYKNSFIQAMRAFELLSNKYESSRKLLLNALRNYEKELSNAKEANKSAITYIQLMRKAESIGIKQLRKLYSLGSRLAIRMIKAKLPVPVKKAN